MIAARIAALAACFSDGEVEASEDELRSALDRVSPRPRVERVGDLWRVHPSSQLPRVDGEAWVLEDDEPRPARGEELRALKDDFGEADFELDDPGEALALYAPVEDQLQLYTQSERWEPLGFGRPTLVQRAFLSMTGPGVEVRRYDLPREVAARSGLGPTTWTQPGPWSEVVSAVAAQVAGELAAREKELPETTRLVQDLLVNGLGHRSWRPAFREQPVVVELAPGELRVRSPGCLVRGVSVDPNLGLVGCCPRNPRMMATFRALGLARLVADQARPTLVERARDVALELSFEHSATEVIATLRRSRSLRVVERRPSRPEDDHRRILQLLGREGQLTRKQLESTLALPRSTVNKRLTTLLEQGRIERTEGAGRSRFQAYRKT